MNLMCVCEMGALVVGVISALLLSVMKGRVRVLLYLAFLGAMALFISVTGFHTL